MPEVYVRNWRLNEHHLRLLIAELPEAVSSALNIPDNPDAEVRPEHIEVFLEESCPSLDRYHDRDFRVRIEAMYFPERAADLQERIKRIESAILNTLGTARFYIWVVLPAAAGFIEYPPGTE